MLTSDGRALCCKTYNFPDSEVDFIADILIQLVESGFPYGPRIVATRDRRLWAKRNDKPVMVTNWIKGRSPNFETPSEWKQAIRTLASFHRYAQFPILREVPAGRERYTTLTSVIADYRTTLQHVQDIPVHAFIFLCDEATRYLGEPKSMEAVKCEAAVRAWVHGDYNYPNLILDRKGFMRLIDFENTSLQARMTDLAHILHRNAAWDCDELLRWIDYYDRFRPLSAEDRFLLYALLHVPYPLVRAIRSKISRDKWISTMPPGRKIDQYISGLRKII
ncbi:phosphotransferase [Cohnella nanjingensis]|nr:phosphotransferase [Cohnella nanjingensis]